jgi:signal transduction histidine kinase
VEEVLYADDIRPRAWLLATSVVIALPLAWRAASPGAAAVVSCLGYLATGLVSEGPFAPQLAVLPVLVLVFSAACQTRGRAALATGVVTAALMVGAHLATAEGDRGDFWPWLLWGGAWGCGAFVQRRSDAAAFHASRAARLEEQARTTAADAAQRERDRIAGELHDVVAHAVSVMVVQAGAERLRLGAEGGRTEEVLAAIEDSGRQALVELRTMLGVLRDEGRHGDSLVPLPGLTELPELVERLRGTGLRVCLVAAEADLERRLGLPSAIELAAYRIVQESLTNVVRHAGPVETTVRVASTSRGIDLEVRNAPPARHPGATDAPEGSGRGIVGMRERAAAVGGELTATREPDGGFRVHATLPVAHAVTRAPA